MALFGFKKKEEARVQQGMPQSQANAGVPTDLVLQMRAQGLSNNQTIQNLQRMGYKSSQIFDAINQADIKGGIEASPMEPMSESDLENPIQPMLYGQQQMQQIQPPQTMPPVQPPQYSPYAQPAPLQTQAQAVDTRHVEELVETIVEEKWNSIAQEISKVVEWKNKFDARISAIEQDMKNLRNDFDQLHQAVVGKVGEYDQHILNVGTEIKAMEKVFQKVIPSLTENVNELGRITEDLKGKKEKTEKK
ncbi:MAG TPA: hypothetical protein VI894_01355 [Candidatus Nanoarchaeia archaeon]|nr:hypothetical protein [Candidatus Nanoarchaeia archaeon]